VERRGPREPVDPWQPARAISEQERGATGRIESVHTLFLVNRECPWHCLMCDLWRHTLDSPTPPGSVPQQIAGALDRLPPADVLKLYNAGSFFDRQAIPPTDHPAIARLCRPFSKVVVESHPALVGDPVLRFRDQLRGRLEVAMGLETTHPATLSRLNKGMKLPQFHRAAEFLRAGDIDLRAFVLLRPPFLSEAEGLEWAVRSLDYAQRCGATVVVLIPTRPGNGATDALQTVGQFSPPRLQTLEQALEAGLNRRRGRVFADLWDLERFSSCPACFPRRLTRLHQMNLHQETLPPVTCPHCAGP
jgi:hypothetical protein